MPHSMARELNKHGSRHESGGGGIGISTYQFCDYDVWYNTSPNGAESRVCNLVMLFGDTLHR